jgi:diguanylate cyclase (GGDEF)-like protein
MAISQLQANYEEVTHAPFTDGLTGVFNHGFFHISLEREMGKGARYEVTFTLAFIDIDWFSNFNKQHGSVEGDRNLREVATAIKENIRQTDLVARYSSDVFAVILMKSDVEVVTRVAERIRNAVEKRSSGNLTVSIGLAAFPRDANKVVRPGIYPLDPGQKGRCRPYYTGRLDARHERL